MGDNAEVITLGVNVENMILSQTAYKYVHFVKRMNVDCWLHVAEFCDIKERGRLFITQGFYSTPWSDLAFHYFYEDNPALLRELVYKRWDFMKEYCIVHNHTLALPNGQQTSCWSPWCIGEQLSLTRNSAVVQFHPLFNVKHARFIQWVRQLAQTKYGFRMLEPKQLLARYKWQQYCWVCTKGGLMPIMFPINTFRVRVYMHGLPCPRVERGMLVLRVVEFEFKSNG